MKHLKHQSKHWLEKFARSFKTIWFDQKIFAYVKDENANMNTMTIILKSIVSCEALGVMESL